MQQSNWQIKNGLIDFNEALALFIKYFTKHINTEQNYNSAINLYCDLYLFSSESTSIKLLTEILKKELKYVVEIFSKTSFHTF